MEKEITILEYIYMVLFCGGLFTVWILLFFALGIVKLTKNSKK